MRSAKIRLVGLDEAREQGARIRAQHGAELVQEQPGRLVAPDPGVSLELEGGDALLVTFHEEDGEQPGAKRDACPVQHHAHRE